MGFNRGALAQMRSRHTPDIRGPMQPGQFRSMEHRTGPRPQGMPLMPGGQRQGMGGIGRPGGQNSVPPPMMPEPRKVRDGGPTGLDLGDGNTLAWLGGYGKSAYDVDKAVADPFSLLGQQGFGSGNKKYGDELNRVLAWKALQEGKDTFDSYRAVQDQSLDEDGRPSGNWDKELVGQRNVADFFDPTKKYTLAKDTGLAQQLTDQKYLQGPGGSRINEMLAGLLGRGITDLNQLAPDGQGGFINKATGQRISGDIGKTYAGHGMSNLKLGAGKDGKVTPYAQWKDTGDKKTLSTLGTIASIAGMAFGVPPALMAMGNAALTTGMTGDFMKGLQAGAGSYLGAKLPGVMGGFTKGMNPVMAGALKGGINAGARGLISGKGLQGSLQDVLIGAGSGGVASGIGQYVGSPLASFAQQQGFNPGMAQTIGNTAGGALNNVVQNKMRGRNTDMQRLLLNSGMNLGQGAWRNRG